MDKLKFYTYTKCSNCNKAQKYLEKLDIKFSLIDIKSTPPTKQELKKMLTFVEEKKKLFNTSGQVYRELKLKDKLADMSDNEALELLANNGMLIKRPFLLGTNFGTVGFKEEKWYTLLQ